MLGTYHPIGIKSHTIANGIHRLYRITQIFYFRENQHIIDIILL